MGWIDEERTKWIKDSAMRRCMPKEEGEEKKKEPKYEAIRERERKENECTQACCYDACREVLK